MRDIYNIKVYINIIVSLIVIVIDTQKDFETQDDLDKRTQGLVLKKDKEQSNDFKNTLGPFLKIKKINVKPFEE
mgnify:CR=1 FL=1